MKKDDNIISIIVAVYNVERYLTRCIESLTRQIYSNIEVILVDDGSTDRSAAICDEWSQKDSRFIVYHQKNQGVSAARNQGISIASGKYIIFVDSDDWVENDFVVELAENYCEREWVFAAYYIDYEYIHKMYHVIKKYSGENICSIKRIDIVPLFMSGLFSPIWNKMYERKILVEKGILFRKEMNLGEDIVFNLEYLKELKGNICVINKPLYHYMRYGEVGLSNSYNENYVDQQKLIYRKFLEYIDTVSENQISRTQIYRLYFDALVTGIDNLYLNRNNIEKELYSVKMTERKTEPEFRELLNHMSGRTKIIYTIRYFFLVNGFYIVDFYLRKVIKKILRLE